LPCHSPFLLCSLLPARAPDFSLTGFWFSLSADYGLEKPENKTVKAIPGKDDLRNEYRIAALF